MKYLLVAMAICMFQSARAERLIDSVVLISGIQTAQLQDDKSTNLLAQDSAGVSLDWCPLDWSVSGSEIADRIDALPATAAGFNGIVMIDAERAETLLGGGQ
jgi:hypothetical protein